MRGKIHRTEGTADEVVFEILASGDTRDAFQAHEKPWVLKCEIPARSRTKAHNCKDEWNLYLKNDALRKILPQCYGLGSFHIQGHDGVALLTERVDETMGQAYAKMRILEPSSARTTLMLHMIMRTVTQMKTTADEGKYCLRDWHVRNIAFNLESEAGSIVDVKLIDWAGHFRDQVQSTKKLMESAMNAFLNSLPGPEWFGVMTFLKDVSLKRST